MQTPPPVQLFQMMTGFAVSQAVFVAARLNVAELIGDGDGEAVEHLARRAGVRAEPLYRVLRALAEERGLRPRVAPVAEERSGIVMLPSDDPRRDVESLAAAGFVTDARPGHVRVSPYFYNVPDDHRALIEHLTRGR